MLRSVKGSERYIVIDGCMFLNKCPTKLCLVKEEEEEEEEEEEQQQQQQQ